MTSLTSACQACGPMSGKRSGRFDDDGGAGAGAGAGKGEGHAEGPGIEGACWMGVTEGTAHAPETRERISSETRRERLRTVGTATSLVHVDLARWRRSAAPPRAQLDEAGAWALWPSSSRKAWATA